MRSGDSELLDVVNRYVDAPVGTKTRRYMKLLGGNFVGLPPAERTTFLQDLVDAATEITDHELGVLLESDWRSRITAAWLIGVSRRSQFRQLIRELLLASELVFAGQGYCFALARFGTAEDAEILVGYLNRYLPPPDRNYAQDWVLGALQHIDANLSTRYAAQFTQPDGLWQHWATRYGAEAIDQKERIDVLCSLVEEAVRSP